MSLRTWYFLFVSILLNVAILGLGADRFKDKNTFRRVLVVSQLHVIKTIKRAFAEAKTVAAPSSLPKTARDADDVDGDLSSTIRSSWWRRPLRSYTVSF